MRIHKLYRVLQVDGINDLPSLVKVISCYSKSGTEE
jgi:hypothetical protein